MSAVKMAAMLAFFGADLDVTALANLAKYDLFFFKTANEDLVTPGVGTNGEAPIDWATVKAEYVDPMVALNPHIVIGLYVGAGGAFSRQLDPAYEFTSDDQALHQPDGDVLEFTINPGNTHYRWTNYIRDGVRTDHISQYLDFLETYGFDAVFFDSWLPSFNSTFLVANDAESAGGSQEGPTHTAAWWLEALPTWTRDLTAALEAEGKVLYVNGIAPLANDSGSAEDELMGVDNGNIPDYATGALFETFYLSYTAEGSFSTYLTAVTRCQENRGAVFCLAIPWLWSLLSAELRPTILDEETLRRFYLATYLLVQDERSSFGFQPYEHIAYFGIDGSSNPRVYWHTDLERDFGAWSGGWYTDGPLYVREYDRGVVVVNPTATAYSFTRAGWWRVWGVGPRIEIGPGASDDTTVSSLPVPARTGWWFERAAA